MAQGDTDKAAWSVLVYMAGDNNLTEDMAWGLQELKKKAGELEARNLPVNERINVVAHFDPRSSRSRRYEFAPPSRINLPPPAPGEDGNLHSYEAMIYTRGNNGAGNGQPGAARNADSGAVKPSNPFRMFVQQQVAAARRADNYFLILSGHGSGAMGDFLLDSDPPTSLSIPELAQILGTARKYLIGEDRLPPEFRLAILGMDSCLMSNAEVCFEIREHVDYVVASEGWVANAGWPYHRVLEACVNDTGADRDADSVARKVAERFSNFYRDYEISGISTDIAVCSLQNLREHEEAVCAQLQRLSRECVRSFDAVFVKDVLAREKIDEKRDRVPQLANEIARLLTEEPERDLEASLANGSTKAREELHKVRNFQVLSGTQRRAAREFVESFSGAYGLADDDLAQWIEANWGELAGAFNEPRSASVALGLVRLIRELDPGVLGALRRIEDQEREGRPEAKQARALLQKLHQVQCVLELDTFAKELVRGVQGDVEFLSAVVASRWKAQSFKGGVYVDLIDLCRCLGDAVGGQVMKTVCSKVVDSVNLVVLESLHTGTASQHANGLSVYFPCHAADYSSTYDNLEFAKKTGWGRLVRAYLRATRRERRDEQQNWADIGKQIVRFGRSEVDPLETDGIEARIVGVIAAAPPSARTAKTDGKEGIEGKIREGIEGKIREGIEGKIREGIEGKIRGEVARLLWGNPPDGFFRSVPLQNGARTSRIDDNSAPYQDQ